MGWGKVYKPMKRIPKSIDKESGIKSTPSGDIKWERIGSTVKFSVEIPINQSILISNLPYKSGDTK